MEVSYKKLWKLLIDKDMKKKDLQALSGISWSSMTKLSKGETVSMEILMKICQVLKCDIGDIMELLPVEKEAKFHAAHDFSASTLWIGAGISGQRSEQPHLR